MPIYEYRCSACDHLTELLLGLNDPPPQFCPSCGAEDTMRKAFAPPAIVFKGSGWAKKDRASASKSSAPKTEGKADGRSDSGSSDGGSAGDTKTGGDSSSTPSSTSSSGGDGG